MRHRTRLEQLAVKAGGLEPARLCDLVFNHFWRIDWKKEGFDYGCIYVIGPHKRWPMKIGISTAPAKRLNALQTSVWEPLKVHHLFFAHSPAEALLVEQRAHGDLERQRKELYGEWFDLRPDEAADAVEFAALASGVEVSREPYCGRDHPMLRRLARKLDWDNSRVHIEMMNSY